MSVWLVVLVCCCVLFPHCGSPHDDEEAELEPTPPTPPPCGNPQLEVPFDTVDVPWPPDPCCWRVVLLPQPELVPPDPPDFKSSEDGPPWPDPDPWPDCCCCCWVNNSITMTTVFNWAYTNRQNEITNYSTADAVRRHKTGRSTTDYKVTIIELTYIFEWV